MRKSIVAERMGFIVGVIVTEVSRKRKSPGATARRAPRKTNVVEFRTRVSRRRVVFMKRFKLSIQTLLCAVLLIGSGAGLVQSWVRLRESVFKVDEKIPFD